MMGMESSGTLAPAAALIEAVGVEAGTSSPSSAPVPDMRMSSSPPSMFSFALSSRARGEIVEGAAADEDGSEVGEWGEVTATVGVPVVGSITGIVGVGDLVAEDIVKGSLPLILRKAAILQLVS
ncbi:hypothetical protein BDZ91DRAFT_716796 [Kalaharituber pfeilii]|nr:hypothetical protein BDZ91DRAFT_716796 [Kalaharituber pfeilii]